MNSNHTGKNLIKNISNVNSQNVFSTVYNNDDIFNGAGKYIYFNFTFFNCELITKSNIKKKRDNKLKKCNLNFIFFSITFISSVLCIFTFIKSNTKGTFNQPLISTCIVQKTQNINYLGLPLAKLDNSNKNSKNDFKAPIEKEKEKDNLNLQNNYNSKFIDKLYKTLSQNISITVKGYFNSVIFMPTNTITIGTSPSRGRITGVSDNQRLASRTVGTITGDSLNRDNSSNNIRLNTPNSYMELTNHIYFADKIKWRLHTRNIFSLPITLKNIKQNLKNNLNINTEVTWDWIFNDIYIEKARYETLFFINYMPIYRHPIIKHDLDLGFLIRHNQKKSHIIFGFNPRYKKFFTTYVHCFNDSIQTTLKNAELDEKKAKLQKDQKPIALAAISPPFESVLPASEPAHVNQPANLNQAESVTQQANADQAVTQGESPVLTNSLNLTRARSVIMGENKTRQKKEKEEKKVVGLRTGLKTNVNAELINRKETKK